MPEKPRSHFCRLFAGHRDGFPDEPIRRLAEHMMDTEANRRGRARTPTLLPSGYIYFAQLIDHDLVKDNTLIAEAGKTEPEAMVNFRTPRLDLEVLYGAGPSDDGHLYERDGTTLKIGLTEETPATSSHPKIGASPNDLPRQANGMADIYDFRDDVSLLIAQLHVMFLKFHNRVVQLLSKGQLESQGPKGSTLFEQARRIVTWHYQWLARYDFLPKIVRPDVLTDIETNWPKLYRPGQKRQEETVRIPVEFSLAAYQFGHSSSQPQYTLNRYIGFRTLLDTIRLTGFGGFKGVAGVPEPQQPKLPAIAVLDQARMFSWAPAGRRNLAEDFDTLIAKDLYAVPGSGSLPELALRRGSLVGLPTGQEACELSGIPSLGADQMGFDDEEAKFLHEYGMLHRTPLFYYLMREAEVAGRMNPGDRAGKCLGPLGSRIVAEVLLGVITADPNSFVHANWKPSLIASGSSMEPMRIDSLRRLSIFADKYSSAAK